MREHKETDFVIPFAKGDVTLEDPEGRTVGTSTTRQIRGNVELRISLEDVEGLVEVAKAFEKMQEAVWNIPAAIGPLAEPGHGSARIRSNPTYRVSTGPFFENLHDITLGGERFSFEQDWTDVIICDIGHALTFRATEPDDGYSVAVGLSREDLELHLEAFAAPTMQR
jgi:hypothetical protein